LGLNDSDVAARIGTPRTTFHSRLKKARLILEKEFPEIF
jgi:DNA-directed RNA polymerase specialized sigma24 family protein